MIITNITKVNGQEERGMVRVPMCIMMGLSTKGRGKMIGNLRVSFLSVMRFIFFKLN